MAMGSVETAIFLSLTATSVASCLLMDPEGGIGGNNYGSGSISGGRTSCWGPVTSATTDTFHCLTHRMGCSTAVAAEEGEGVPMQGLPQAPVSGSTFRAAPDPVLLLNILKVSSKACFS